MKYHYIKPLLTFKLKHMDTLKFQMDLLFKGKTILKERKQLNERNINRIYLMAEALGCNFKVSPKGRYITFVDDIENLHCTISFEQFLAADHFVLRSSISAQFELLRSLD